MTHEKKAVLAEFVLESLTYAARNINPLPGCTGYREGGAADIAVSRPQKDPSRVQVAVAVDGKAAQYDVAVTEPGFWRKAGNIARLGYFVDVARMIVTPASGGAKVFPADVVNSDTGMTVYGRGAERAVKWMVKQTKASGAAIPHN